jgi:hypothetical protein
MKCRLRFASFLVFLLTAAPSVSRAAIFNFTLDTTAFMSVPAANQPLYLYFALANGGGTVDNTATINNFTLGNNTIGAFGTGVNNQGGENVLINTLAANGSGGVTITDSGFASGQYLQQWTPGDFLAFTVTTSDNTDSPLDTFIFAILYTNQVPGAGSIDLNLLTGDPNLPSGFDYDPFFTTGGISQLEFFISNGNNNAALPPNANGNVFFYQTLPEGSQLDPGVFNGAVPAAPFVIPEPSTYIVWGITALFGGGYLYRRRRMQQILLQPAQV